MGGAPGSTHDGGSCFETTMWPGMVHPLGGWEHPSMDTGRLLPGDASEGGHWLAISGLTSVGRPSDRRPHENPNGEGWRTRGLGPLHGCSCPVRPGQPTGRRERRGGGVEAVAAWQVALEASNNGTADMSNAAPNHAGGKGPKGHAKGQISSTNPSTKE